MNGRLYDPLLGRFLSTDNFVQEPYDSQNFNRYSYCLNNPLKYTDPSGEFLHLLIGAAIGGFTNWMLNRCQWNASGLGYFGVGAFSTAFSSGVASGINVALAGGNFWTGAAGLSKGVSSTGFFAGMATGISSGFTGGFFSAAGNSWINGHGFAEGLMTGLRSGGIGALVNGLLGGLHGGLDALNKGANFWTGNAFFNLNGVYASSGFQIGESTITGKFVGRFEGVNVFESKSLGSINNEFGGITIPERGIIVGEGVFTSHKKYGTALVQHEFGHILQYREVGPHAYWGIIAPESVATSFDDSFHRNYWTETWANYLSKGYFWKDWLGETYGYFAKEISFSNWLRLKTMQSLGIIRMRPRGFI